MLMMSHCYLVTSSNSISTRVLSCYTQIENVMHSFTTLLEIKTWLEQLHKDKHLLLVHLHAAYYNVDATGSITFGQAKKQFWHCLSCLSTFDDGILLAREWPALSIVRVELFLVYPVGHWSRFMATHTINAADVWNISRDRVPEFETLDSTVYPSYNVCLASLIAPPTAGNEMRKIFLLLYYN